MENIKISSEFIKLDQFLKYVSICSSGSEAKFFVLDNDIYVNGELEKRRGRKLRINDIIKVNNNEYIII